MVVAAGWVQFIFDGGMYIQMKTKKVTTIGKIVLSCIAIILVFTAYQIGSVSIYGVAIAEKELSKYAKEELKLNEQIDCKYDWRDDKYLARNNLGFALEYRRQNNTIYNELSSQKELEKASTDYHVLIGKMPDHLTFPKYITVWTEISAEDYDTKAQRLYILGIYNTKDISKQDSLLRPAYIVMDVISELGESYNFTGVQAIYFDKNGQFEIVFPADSFEPITVEKLLSHTTQTPKEEYPEHYINWLAENGIL